ncbi:MAG: nucleoside phosphorylase, partial [Sphaerochaetaceae bacterium]|nr:nucleoside phosphorylase [Sphaerochaetaceae bacterium]
MLPFYQEEEFFKASSRLSKFSRIPKKVIIMWADKFLESAKRNYEAKQIVTISGGTSVRVYSFLYKGEEIAIVQSQIGSPASVSLVEEMFALGCKELYAIGTCGRLLPEAAGKIIIPTKAYRDEGTSYHYTSSLEPWAHIKTWERTKNILDSLNIQNIVGPIWTTDAVYRETPSAIKAMQKESCLGVEMECSALETVCSYRNIRFAQVVFPA